MGGFSATDESKNVFNPGDIASRAFGGNIDFGVSNKTIKTVAMIVGVVGVLAVAAWYFARRTR